MGRPFVAPSSAEPPVLRPSTHYPPSPAYPEKRDPIPPVDSLPVDFTRASRASRRALDPRLPRSRATA
jgi:hypothetical protein